MSLPVSASPENYTITFPEVVWMMYMENGPNRAFLIASLSWMLASLIAMCRISNTMALVLHNLFTVIVILFSPQIDAYYFSTSTEEAVIKNQNKAYTEALSMRATLFIAIPNLIILLVGGMRLLRLFINRLWSLNTMAYQVRALGLKKAERDQDSSNISQ